MQERRCSAGSKNPAQWFALLVLILLNGCTSNPVLKPGTGDLSFRLTWDGTADLDLYVKSPQGDRIDFVNPTGGSGGVLDIDCNAHQEAQCPQPMENIFWPRRQAPEGAYTYWVVVAGSSGLEASDRFVLEVRVRGKVVRDLAGLVTELGEGLPPKPFAYARR